MKKITAFLILTLTANAWAVEVAPSPTPSPEAVSSLKKVCAQPGEKPELTQLSCDARENAVKATNSNATGAAIWSSVALYCMTACLTSEEKSKVIKSKYCTIANLGASAADMIRTKDYIGALSGVGTSLLGNFMTAQMTHKSDSPELTTTADATEPKKGSEKLKDKLKDKSKNMQLNACLPALNAGRTAFNLTRSAVERKKELKKIDKDWLALNSTRAPATSASPTPKPSPSPSPKGSTGGGPSGGGSVITINNGKDSGTGGGSSASTNGCSASLAAAIACAKLDKVSLPSTQTLKQIDSGLKKVVGKGIDDALKNKFNPMAGIGAAAGPLASAGGSPLAREMAEAFGQLAHAAGETTTSSSGSGGNSGSNSSSGDGAGSAGGSELDVAAILKGAMGGGEKTGEDASGEEVAEASEEGLEEFEGERSPAEELFEGFLLGADRSLFQSVERRYGESEKRGLLLEVKQ
jgi:uncharacterized membrane protein YgcG